MEEKRIQINCIIFVIIVVYVGELSLRFEYFQSERVYVTVLAFISFMLDAKFYTESNGVIYEGSHR